MQSGKRKKNHWRLKKEINSIDVKSALRNAGTSAKIHVRLVGEAAERFNSLLGSVNVSAETAASALLSSLLLEHPEISRLIAESRRDAGNKKQDLHSMSLTQIRYAYRKHLITKETLEAYLAALSKKYSGRLGLMAEEAFHLNDARAKKSFYSWIRFLRTGNGFHLPEVTRR